MSNGPLRVTVTRHIPEDKQFISSWNDLVTRTESPQVFYTHQWAAAAACSLQQVCPLLFLVYDTDGLCGIAPLATRPSSPGTACFLTASSADYCDVLSEPQVRGEILSALFAEITKLGIHDLELANVPADSPTLPQLRGIAAAHGFRLHERPAYECPLIVFGTEQQRQQLLERICQRKHKKRDLRIDRLGPRFAHVPNDQIQTELRSIFSAHIARFLATHRVSPLARPERRLLLTELARRLGEAGWLTVSRLEIGGCAAAWHFGFRFRDSLFWYLPTFAMEYEDYSPGSYLFRRVIEEGCRDPTLQVIDLGLGEETYKERYANALRPTSYLRLSSRAVDHWRNIVRYSFARNVQRSRTAELTLRRLRDHGRDLRAEVQNTGFLKTAARNFSKVSRYIHVSEEVQLFERLPMEAELGGSSNISQLDWQQVADAAMEYCDDPETLRYLMRCAARLTKGRAQGFVLRSGSSAKHFLWIDRFDGFYLAELKYKVQSTDPAAVMIFDCWTPPGERGRGHYSNALRLAGAYLQQQQKHPWIFSSTRNQGSTRGISKAGFIYRLSLVKSSWLTSARVEQRPASPPEDAH